MSNPFSPRVAAAVVIVGVASATLALGLTAVEPGPPLPNEAGAHALSDSAVGTRSLLRLLHKLDVRARVATTDAAFRDTNVLAIEILPATPKASFVARAKNHIDTAGAALVVLPKWQTTPDPDHRGWVKSASLVPIANVELALSRLGIDCTVIRPNATPSFGSPYSVAPTLGSTQLIAADCPDLAFIIQAGDGMLLARWQRDIGEVWVLSDPDLISNHGIDDGQNAELAMAILSDLAVYRDEIAFDETIHGFGKDLSLRRKLLSPPLSYAALSAIFAALILLWMGSGRFGAPVAKQPAIAPGKTFLINNTAALLLHGGHTQHMLTRYFDTAIGEVLRRHNADTSMARPDAIAWLDRIAEARGHESRLGRIVDDVARISAAAKPSGPKIAALADQIYHWKREMLDQ